MKERVQKLIAERGVCSRRAAEKLIEDFMLMANETVAYNMKIMSLPCVYRIHEKPDQEKLKEAFSMLGKMGVSVELPKKERRIIFYRLITDLIDLQLSQSCRTQAEHLVHI